MNLQEFTDHETLTALLYEQEGPLRAYLQFCGIRQEDLDDVMQEVMVTAWRKISTLRDISAFPSWIRSIARRKAIKHHRRMERYWMRNYPLSRYTEELEEAGRPMPEELIYREMEKFSQSELCGLVRELGDTAANILILHYVYRERYVDIARILGIPPATVRSKADRSLDKLKEMILERSRREKEEGR